MNNEQITVGVYERQRPNAPKGIEYAVGVDGMETPLAYILFGYRTPQGTSVGASVGNILYILAEHMAAMTERMDDPPIGWLEVLQKVDEAHHIFESTFPATVTGTYPDEDPDEEEAG